MNFFFDDEGGLVPRLTLTKVTEVTQYFICCHVFLTNFRATICTNVLANDAHNSMARQYSHRHTCLIYYELLVPIIK